LQIHIIGASGRSGAALARAVRAAGHTVVPVVRSAARYAATNQPESPKIADLTDPAALKTALQSAEAIVSTAHARQIPAILAASPPEVKRFIFLGSTRKFTAWPDAHGNGVLAGEAAFIASNRPGVLLHPTMIYGAEGEDNVRRLASLLRYLPFVPLPKGGISLVQPIYQDDVTACILAALAIEWHAPHSIVIAGPEPVKYADFVRAIAHASGTKRIPKILPLPAAALMAAATITRLIPGFPKIGPDEIRRLCEDKAFDITPMRATLGVTPRPLHEGLAQTFAP